VQLSQGGQNARRSRDAYKNTLEKLIIKDLIKMYKGQEIVIQNDLFCYMEVPELKINLDYLRFAFGDFKRISVDQFGVHVAY
jgi:hypothetical protein